MHALLEKGEDMLLQHLQPGDPRCLTGYQHRDIRPLRHDLARTKPEMARGESADAGRACAMSCSVAS
ncbi:MAG: hypothetical protein A2V78_12380 [Betaproteobacteria bacterium RBG_16_64_18]|nr:MAG: hypothetical protein A2V78_12380 [Betaproteobacteria bacterium RBG_16_64_18]